MIRARCATLQLVEAPLRKVAVTGQADGGFQRRVSDVGWLTRYGRAGSQGHRLEAVHDDLGGAAEFPRGLRLGLGQQADGCCPGGWDVPNGERSQGRRKAMIVSTKAAGMAARNDMAEAVVAEMFWCR